MPSQVRPTKDALIAAYLAGASITELAQQFGIAVGTVYGQLQRAEVPLRSRARSLTAPPSPAAIDAIGVAYRAGATMREIARERGLSTNAVERALHAAGGTRRPRRPRRSDGLGTQTAGDE